MQAIVRRAEPDQLRMAAIRRRSPSSPRNLSRRSRSEEQEVGRRQRLWRRPCRAVDAAGYRKAPMTKPRRPQPRSLVPADFDLERAESSPGTAARDRCIPRSSPGAYFELPDSHDRSDASILIPRPFTAVGSALVVELRLGGEIGEVHVGGNVSGRRWSHQRMETNTGRPRLHPDGGTCLAAGRDP